MERKGQDSSSDAAFQTQLFLVLFGTVCVSQAELPAGGTPEEGQLGVQLQGRSDR